MARVVGGASFCGQTAAAGNRRRAAVSRSSKNDFPDAAEEERQMEMHEGLAEYTGVKLSGSPNPNQFVIDRSIAEVLQKETFVCSFAYASGPAYGILLDETKVDWRKNLKKEDDLANLLQKQFLIKSLPPTVQTVEARAKKYDAEKLQAAETERENSRQKLLAEYRSKFVDNTVLRLNRARVCTEICGSDNCT